MNSPSFRNGISRRAVLAGLGSGLILSSTGVARAGKPTKATVSRLYRRALVIDGLCLPISKPEGLEPRDLKAIASSGMTAVNATVGVEDWDEALAEITLYDREIRKHKKHLTRVRDYTGLVRAKRNKKLGVIYGVQGSLLIGRDLDRLETLYGLGVRIHQITYNRGDLVGDGCLEARDGGLTKFGHSFIKRLEALKIAVDVSHSGRRTTRDALAATKRPPLLTHSGCDAVYKHPRNSEDATIRQVADQGGVFGIYFMPFLGGDPGAPATLDLTVQHTEHALRVAGTEHVGIGSDQIVKPYGPDDQKQKDDWVAERKRRGIAAPEEDRPFYVSGLNAPNRIELFAHALAKRGHSSRVIENIIGANFARALKQIWA